MSTQSVIKFCNDVTLNFMAKTDTLRLRPLCPEDESKILAISAFGC